MWAVLVYFPVAHWVFAFDGVVTEDSVGGWIANKLQAIDFAGGTAVHINAGAAALAVAIVLGKSLMFGQLRKPHNVPLTLLGAGLLWAGWYAFNGGSALAAGNSAAIVMVTTFVATCAADAGLAGGREDQGRPRHRCRRGVRRRHRAGRHHPRLRRRHPDRRDLRRRRSPARSARYAVGLK